MSCGKQRKVQKEQLQKEITNIDKDCNKSVDNISYKTKFIDSIIFLTTSLPSFVHNLSVGIHKIKCKDCDCFLEYESVKDNLKNINVYLAIKIIQTKLMKN